jgi:hypothetical protein
MAMLMATATDTAGTGSSVYASCDSPSQYYVL